VSGRLILLSFLAAYFLAVAGVVALGLGAEHTVVVQPKHVWIALCAAAIPAALGFLAGRAWSQP
jgi:ABC-type branched-subunit amino acid transport system permease subunit